MALSPDGTFDYVATVPNTIENGCFECRAELRRPAMMNGEHGARLVGWAPLMQVTIAGPRLDAPPYGERSRVTLIATERELARVAQTFFDVDHTLMQALQPGDEIFLTRTRGCGFGLTVLRNNLLLVGVGALANMETGAGLTVKVSRPSVSSATAASLRFDSRHECMHSPVELIVGDRSHVLLTGRGELPPFEFEVAHGHIMGLPGPAESVAIWRTGDPLGNAARMSREMLDVGGSLHNTLFPDDLARLREPLSLTPDE